MRGDASADFRIARGVDADFVLRRDRGTDFRITRREYVEKTRKE